MVNGGWRIQLAEIIVTSTIDKKLWLELQNIV